MIPTRKRLENRNLKTGQPPAGRGAGGEGFWTAVKVKLEHLSRNEKASRLDPISVPAPVPATDDPAPVSTQPCLQA